MGLQKGHIQRRTAPMLHCNWIQRRGDLLSGLPDERYPEGQVRSKQPESSGREATNNIAPIEEGQQI